MAGVELLLEGKTALITGGSRGIGAETVRLFRAAGARVAFSYRQAAEQARELERELNRGVEGQGPGTRDQEPERQGPGPEESGTERQEPGSWEQGPESRGIYERPIGLVRGDLSEIERWIKPGTSYLGAEGTTESQAPARDTLHEAVGEFRIEREGDATGSPLPGLRGSSFSGGSLARGPASTAARGRGLGLPAAPRGRSAWESGFGMAASETPVQGGPQGTSPAADTEPTRLYESYGFEDAEPAAAIERPYEGARAAADALGEARYGRSDLVMCVGIEQELETAADGRALVEKAVVALGRLDILVVNHGIWPPEDAPIATMGDEQWRRTMGVNLDAVFGLVQGAVAAMQGSGIRDQGPGEQGQRDTGTGDKDEPVGHIVLISSTAGQRGEAFHADYAASKGALISLTKSLSSELAPRGIRVNCVAPGWVDTEMAAGTLGDPELGPKVRAQIPVGRPATPREIAGPVLFLCTPLAGFISGEVLNVNGGAVLVG